MLQARTLMRPNKIIFLALLCAPQLSLAEPTQQWVEDRDGEIAPNEYRVIDPAGGVTRRPCPYTCEMRGFPKKHCKEWKSVTKAQDGECYVQDLRVSTDDAMPTSASDDAKAESK